MNDASSRWPGAGGRQRVEGGWAVNITTSRRRRFLLIVLPPLGFLIALIGGQSMVAAVVTEMLWLASLAWAIPGWRWFAAEQGNRS